MSRPFFLTWHTLGEAARLLSTALSTNAADQPSRAELKRVTRGQVVNFDDVLPPELLVFLHDGARALGAGVPSTSVPPAFCVPELSVRRSPFLLATSLFSFCGAERI